MLHITIYIHMHTLYAIIYSHTHMRTLLFFTTDEIVAIGLVAEHDFIEDSFGIALKLHNFILTFHCNASLN